MKKVEIWQNSTSQLLITHHYHWRRTRFTADELALNIKQQRIEEAYIIDGFNKE